MKKTVLVFPVGAPGNLFASVNFLPDRGAAFTRQGRLSNAGSPAGGTCSSTFPLCLTNPGLSDEA